MAGKGTWQNAKNVVAGGGLVERVLAEHPGMFRHILENADRYRFQVLLSLVQEDEHGKPHLLRDGFRVDREYFYPASAIKLCAVVAVLMKLKSLEKLIGMQIPSVSPLSFYPLVEGKEEERIDLSNLDFKRISIAHEVRKILLVSDNVAFNRLYSIVGHRTINETMWNLGLKSSRLQHRLSVNLSLTENKICEPVELNIGGIVATLAPKRSQLLVPDNNRLHGVEVGAAHVTPNGELVLEPMDFSKKNYISLTDLQNLLVKIVRKDIELDAAPITISEDVRMMLMTAMSQYPFESSNPKYEISDFPDDYCKFFLPGLARVRRKGALRIFNKVGRAYGFTVDNAYVFDVETGQNFFLSSVIYTNANDIVNDDKYEYSLADAVMADLAEVIARAVWEVSPSLSSSSSSTDYLPSSLWNPCAYSSFQPTTSKKEQELEQHVLPLFGYKSSDFASENLGIKNATSSLITNTSHVKDEKYVRDENPSPSDCASGLRTRIITGLKSCSTNQPYVCSSRQNSSIHSLQGVTSSSAEVTSACYRQQIHIGAHNDSLVDKTYCYFVDQ